MKLLLASQLHRHPKGFKNPLTTLLKQAMPLTTRVQAAVAYVSRADHALFDACRRPDIKIPLELWARHDAMLATSPEVMGRFLKEADPNFICYLIGQHYHPKIIWWHGYGVYIGSANLTPSAWGGNIEGGVVIREDELDIDDMRGELQAFFEDMRELGTLLSREIYDDALRHREAMKAFQAAKLGVAASFRNLSSYASIQNRSLADIVSTRDPNKKLHTFRAEWEGTLQHLRNLQAIVAAPENRPEWMPPDAPAAIQVDQFLHSVYYNRVRQGAAIPYEDWFKRNHLRSKAVVDEFVQWWRESKQPEQEGELVILTKWVATHRRLLTHKKLGALTESEFVEAARCIHAINDHAKRRRSSELGEIEHDDDTDVLEERRNRHCQALYYETNAMGWTPPKLLEHLIWGGPWHETADRLYRCVRDPDYKIPRLGLSALGEFVGWGLPEHFPPRNDRTNKALRALGYNVHVNSPNKSGHG